MPRISQKQVEAILKEIAETKENINPTDLAEIVFHYKHPNIPRCQYLAPDHLYDTYPILKTWWDFIMTHEEPKCGLILICPSAFKPVEFAMSLVNHSAYYILYEKSLRKRVFKQKRAKFIIVNNVKFKPKDKPFWISLMSGAYVSNLKYHLPTIFIFDNMDEIIKMSKIAPIRFFIRNFCFVLTPYSCLAPIETAENTEDSHESIID